MRPIRHDTRFVAAGVAGLNSMRDVVTKDAEKGLAGASVLSLSIERWDHVWRSRHHVMSRLGRDNKVLFASLPPDTGEIKRALRAGRFAPPASAPISDQLREYLPSPWLPVTYRFAALDGLVERMRQRRLREEITRLGMCEPILYIWHPKFVDALGCYRERLVVFHCYDEYSAFHAPDHERRRIQQQEDRLVQSADIVFAASESLARSRRSRNSNVHVIENGVDFDLFSRAQDAGLEVPRAIARLAAPVIGCVLTQLTVVDVQMLIDLLTKRPNWQVAVIGMDRPGAIGRDADLQSLLAKPNLHFLGRQKLDAMPGFLKGCHVCAIPWIVNDITAASSSPLKLYEYFAAGKPIVSARLPLLTHLSELVEFASTSDEWIAAVERALAVDGPALVAQRQRLARQNTWDHRVTAIKSVIASALDARRRSTRPS